MTTTAPAADSAPSPGEARGPAVVPPPRRRGFKRWIFLALLVVGAFALLFIWYRGSVVSDHEYGAAELARIGPVSQIIAWEGGRTAVQFARHSNLPADDLWRVMTDQARFDEFMPYVKETTVRPGEGGKLIERQVLETPYGTYDLELEITLTERDGVRRAAWRQTRGALAFNEGAWVVDEGSTDGPVIRYQVAASMDWVPQFLVNFAMRRRVGRLLEAVERRVAELQQSEPGYFH